MKIHEYQAKALLRNYGVDVPTGGSAATAEEGSTTIRELGAILEEAVLQEIDAVADDGADDRSEST